MQEICLFYFIFHYYYFLLVQRRDVSYFIVKSSYLAHQSLFLKYTSVLLDVATRIFSSLPIVALLPRRHIHNNKDTVFRSLACLNSSHWSVVSQLSPRIIDVRWHAVPVADMPSLHS